MNFPGFPAMHDRPDRARHFLPANFRGNKFQTRGSGRRIWGRSRGRAFRYKSCRRKLDYRRNCAVFRSKRRRKRFGRGLAGRLGASRFANCRPVRSRLCCPRGRTCRPQRRGCCHGKYRRRRWPRHRDHRRAIRRCHRSYATGRSRSSTGGAGSSRSSQSHTRIPSPTMGSSRC
jgi:hypothetical protein